MKLRQHVDPAGFAIIAITFASFTVALFVKGFTKDLLLEIGILLVSIKLIMMAYKNSVIANEIKTELQSLNRTIVQSNGHGPARHSDAESIEVRSVDRLPAMTLASQAMRSEENC